MQDLHDTLVAVKQQKQKEAAKAPRRNERCPCESGKKYKHCCLRKDRGDA